MPQYQHITHNYRPKHLELLRIVATFAAAMCKAAARNLAHNATQSIITFISHNSYTMYLDSEKKKEIFGKYGGLVFLPYCPLDGAHEAEP